MSDLYIIAAGKGSRMGGSIPKALVPLAGQPNLTTTLQQIGHKFEHVFVVINAEVQEPWKKYFKELKKEFPELANNVIQVPISSGRGDGHAVMQALTRVAAMQEYEVALSDDIVIAWGDVFFPDERIIDELLAFTNFPMGMVPVVEEEQPYVGLQVERDGTVKHATFSKHGEDTTGGHHDQSVFRFKRIPLLQSLFVMDAVLNKDGKYITPGNEMSLLHVFHYVSNTTQGPRGEIIAYQTEFPTLSFNTVEEVAAIQQEINEKWQHKFRKDQS